MILGMDDKMPFGQYKDTEIEEILGDDPEYLKWVAEDTDTEFDAEVMDKIARL